MKRGYRGSLVLVALALIGPIACTKPLGSFEQALSENATPEQLETYLKRHKGLRESDKQAKHPPLERSIEARKPKYVELLLKYGADPNQLSYSMTPLIRAMTHCDPAVIGALLEAGAKPALAVGHEFPLLAAAARGCRTGVELLLAKKVDVRQRSDRGETALAAALANGHGELAHLLVQKGATSAGTRGLAIFDGYRKNSASITAFLKRHPDHLRARDERGRDLIHRLALTCTRRRKRCDFTKLDSFFALARPFGLDRRVTGPEGHRMTALHLAARHGHLSMVRLLLAHGASVNLGDDRDATALHYAATVGFRYAPSGLVCPAMYATRHAAIVEALLKKKANPNLRDTSGATALHYAISVTSAAQSRIVTLLLQHGADVNAQDKLGIGPLYLLLSKSACYGNDIDKILRVLLKKGANPSAATTYGKSPISIADERLKKMLEPYVKKSAAR